MKIHKILKFTDNSTDIKIVIHYFLSIMDDKEIAFLFKFQIICVLTPSGDQG